MKKTLLSGVLASVMAITLLVGCGGNTGSRSSGTTGDTIKIGAIGPLSGAASTYGISVKEGAQLLEKEVNAAGGINGKKIQFIFEDDQADPNSSMQAFNKLVDYEKVCAILRTCYIRCNTCSCSKCNIKTNTNDYSNRNRTNNNKSWWRIYV